MDEKPERKNRGVKSEPSASGLCFLGKPGRNQRRKGHRTSEIMRHTADTSEAESCWGQQDTRNSTSSCAQAEAAKAAWR